MQFVPFDWSVVVAGAWNRAILTPQGIGTRLFKLPEETATIQVEIPIDAIGPYRVQHEGLVVVAARGRLIIEPKICTYSELRRAMDIAKIAIEDLPKTPLAAAGINLKYKSTESPVHLKTLLDNEWDTDLSDKGFEISSKSIARSLVWNESKINLTITETTDVQINLNVEKRSTNQQDHMTWLSMPISDLKQVLDTIIFETMHIPAGDITND